MAGFGWCPSPLRPHDQVFLNHSVGSTWSAASCELWLSIVTSTRMSSGEAFAHSTMTSKHPPSNVEVSSSSCSGSASERAPFVRASSSYG